MKPLCAARSLWLSRGVRTPGRWQKTGRREKAVQDKLEELAGRGVLYAFRRPADGSLSYSLWPIDPGGMLENIFADGRMDPRKERLKERYRAYWASGYWNLVSASGAPIFRILPSGAAIEGANDVLVFDQVKSLIEKAGRNSVVRCFCRTLEGGRCGKPMDTCFYFDAWADYAVRYRHAREVSLEEASSILQGAEEAGLVHLTTNFQKGITAVCNCCPCCCHVLKGYLQLKNPNSFVKSNYGPVVDREACQDCGTCRSICPTKALGAAEKGQGSALLAPDRCIGCGLCASNCRERAISMVRVRGHEPPPDFRAAIRAYEEARTGREPG